jgi:penicillin V acylase-like amidase (Ntn superfamily)
MFGGLGDAIKNIGKMQKLMKDDNFKAFIDHPDVKAMMQDPEFQNAIKSKNYMKLMQNQKLVKLMKDPEIQSKISKLNMNDFK